MLQSYRALFMMVEAALLASGFVLIQYNKGVWVLLPGIAGFITVVFWVLVCEAKKRDVDRCRNRIIELQSRVGEEWSNYLQRRFSLSGGNIARYIFNYVIPVLIVALWIFLIVFRPKLGLN